MFTGILGSKFDREESLQCLKEINVPILSLFGDHDNVRLHVIHMSIFDAIMYHCIYIVFTLL